MITDDPLASSDDPYPRFLHKADLIFNIFFTIEIACKVLAQGIVLRQHTYLRDGWNWLDTVVVVVGWVSFSAMGGSLEPTEDNSGGGSLLPLRSIRVLRPLRTVRRIRGMRVVVQSLLHSLPQMATVAALLLFMFILFGVMGIQLFKGQLHWRCVPESIAVEPCARPHDFDEFADRYEYGKACHPSALSVNCTLPELGVSCLPLYADASFLSGLKEFDEQVCDAKANASTVCFDPGSRCTYFTSNPQINVTNFDHFPAAFVTIFYSVTLEGWVDVLYMLCDTSSPPLAIVYMVLLVFFGAFFVINLLLAVIFDKFDEIATEDRSAANRERTTRSRTTVRQRTSINSVRHSLFSRSAEGFSRSAEEMMTKAS
eukprot:1950179-Prymnesium_polylepis.1